MTRRRPTVSATELPIDLMCVGSLNAYEVGSDHIRVAFRLSDANYEVGQLVILRISMTTRVVEVEYSVDSFFMGYHSVPDVRDLLVEIGGMVRRRGDAGWEIAILPAAFLRDAFSLGGQVDFAFGDEGQIFRSQGDGQWQQDSTPTTNKIYAIHGPTSEALHAAGGNGTLLRANGSTWDQIEIGVGTDLRCLLVLHDRIIVAGDHGVAGVLKDDEFRLIESGLESDILSVVAFKDQIYFCDSDWGLHRLSGEQFDPVANLGYAYRLNATERCITIAAGQNFFQFDGKNWRGVEVSYRDGYLATPLDMSVLDE